MSLSKLDYSFYGHHIDVFCADWKTHLCHGGVFEGGRQFLLSVHINVHKTLSKWPFSWYMHHTNAVL